MANVFQSNRLHNLLDELRGYFVLFGIDRRIQRSTTKGENLSNLSSTHIISRLNPYPSTGRLSNSTLCKVTGGSPLSV